MDKGNAFGWQARAWLDCHRIACRTESSRTYVRSTFEFLEPLIASTKLVQPIKNGQPLVQPFAQWLNHLPNGSTIIKLVESLVEQMVEPTVQPI